MRHKGPFFLRAISLVGLILIAAACSPTPTKELSATPTVDSAHLTAFAQPLPTYPPLPTPTATPTPLGGPSAQLGSVPQSCPPGPSPQTIDGNFAAVIGGNPVWAGNFVGPHATLEWSPTQAQQYHNQYGWGHKLLWVVANNVKGLVTIHGADLQTGAPLRPSAEQQELSSTSTTMVLNPQDPAVFRQVDQWVEFPGGVDVPQAGCYYLQASWPGGSWRITFAAGVVLS